MCFRAGVWHETRDRVCFLLAHVLTVMRGVVSASVFAFTFISASHVSLCLHLQLRTRLHLCLREWEGVGEEGACARVARLT